MIFFNVTKKRDDKEGFTLVELLVVISISAIITSIVVSGYPSFLKKSDFDSLVLDVALVVREAQVFGLGAKEAGQGVDSNFDAAYGVQFTKDDPNIVLFVDSINNGVYDGALSGELIRNLTLSDTFSISSLCISEPPSCGFDTFDITFKRPNPDALLVRNGIPDIDYTYATIKFISDGDERQIRIFSTGQVSAARQ